MASEACCTPAPPAEHVEEGKTVEIGGVTAYVNFGPASAKAAIVLVSDIFGYDPPLLRKLADRCGAEGFLAVVPDLFKGDPFVPDDPENSRASIPAWLAKHPPTDTTDVKAVIAALKEQGIQMVGVTGCCWGAKVAVTLAAETPDINAVVLFHPSFVTSEDILASKVPTQILIPEFDKQVPPEKAEEFKAIISSRPEAQGFLKIFPGMQHGWTIRYDVNNAEVVKAAHEAHQDMLDWYKKFLL